MRRTFDQARRWTGLGTELLAKAADIGDEGLAAPSALPGWTRKHVVAHVAANADALGNLVHWAATGEPTPMYASPEQRAADIDRGSRLPADELTVWLRRSAETLAASMDALDAHAWQTQVTTAQGRTVPATELPWMRSREVCVHAVDLASGVAFADLPADFLAALCDDVAAKRATAPGVGLALGLTATDMDASWQLPGDAADAIELTGPVADVAAYLTGRPTALTTRDGGAPPELGVWL
ncbi:MAG: maleylpyruvate isomerase family mycothiol-dependent enzyme [Streptomycetaceae bacterium]|nr:maleylpyruvate isomerase family mycothiol-dependent enzyme [Streptomycetaceae bacterium]